jgi:hypothetical protein
MESLPTYHVAPVDWCYHGFPLISEGHEALTLDWVVDTAEKLIDIAEVTGDEAPFGPTLHWAHRLRIEQDADGAWPAVVNARTGDPIDTGRTRRPARFLRRLGDLLGSVEFDGAVARSSQHPR